MTSYSVAPQEPPSSSVVRAAFDGCKGGQDFDFLV